MTMMTEEQANELGKRAVAAGWKWQEGARTTCGNRACAILRHEALWMYHAISTKPAWGDIRPYHIPDFRDPATLGCLLAQVRERYGDSTIHVQFDEGVWQVAFWNPDNFFWSYWPERHFSTEVEALVACLEAAKESNR